MIQTYPIIVFLVDRLMLLQPFELLQSRCVTTHNSTSLLIILNRFRPRLSALNTSRNCRFSARLMSHWKFPSTATLDGVQLIICWSTHIICVMWVVIMLLSILADISLRLSIFFSHRQMPSLAQSQQFAPMDGSQRRSHGARSECLIWIGSELRTSKIFLQFANFTLISIL